jgi:hypothetical protein
MFQESLINADIIKMCLKLSTELQRLLLVKKFKADLIRTADTNVLGVMLCRKEVQSTASCLMLAPHIPFSI